MNRIQRVSRLCLSACVAACAWSSPASRAQAPVFNFDQSNSSAMLAADVFADDYVIPGTDSDTQTAAGFYSPFPFSGGVVDWGNTLNIVARDGGVTTSANPLVRLDGDGTPMLSIAWKGFNILDSNCEWDYDGSAYSDTDAQILATLDNLVPAQTYVIFFQWTVEGDATTEHETAVQEDPEHAEGSLWFDVGGFGPGFAFDKVVDGDDATVPDAIFFSHAGAFGVYTTTGSSLDVSVDLAAWADSVFASPSYDDLVLTILRGTLNLTVIDPDNPISAVIISEVVDGDLSGGNPKFVELTNCGYLDYTFAADDCLRIYFNGSTTPTTTVGLGGIALAVGDSYVIATSQNDGIAQYQAAYGDDADLYVDQAFGNGNDVYSLEINNQVTDTYGVIGVDGTGEDWDYQDSYANSKPCRGPNGGAFDADDWNIGGPGALDAPTDPERIALLQAFTTPGTHLCCGSPAFPPADMNCDGAVNTFDIDPFVLALTDPFGYAGAYPHCDIFNADVNYDGVVNTFDIDPFVECLIGGGCP